MPPARKTRAPGYLGRGSLLSLLLHAQLLVPLAIAAFIYGGREEARRAEEVDVAFEDVAEEQLPTDLPPLEPPKADDALERLPPDAKKAPKKPLKKKLHAEKTFPKEDLAKRDPEVVVPPLPPMPEPRQPPAPDPHEHLKIVDVHHDKDVPPPPDAQYIAPTNNRVAEETRATRTNLERDRAGEDAPESMPSKQEAEEAGGDKDQIRQLSDEKSALGKKAPSVTAHANPTLASPEERREPSLLALRDPAPRTHEITPETADPSLPRAPDGDLAAPTTRGADSRASKANGKRVKLALTGSDYEYVFGADADADRRLAKKMRSSTFGKAQARFARVRASLENFIPEVKPGNQTALNTRAAPFAAFIARMHRSIHEQWGFGQLEEWDELSASSPLNNPKLQTTLELALNADGTVDKVTIVRGSGYLGFDSAAIDTAFASGPYPDPPREIRSADGKIYVHWRFYRDGRQCSPAYVDYFILDNAPKGLVDNPSSVASADAPRMSAPARERLKHLRRNLDDSPAHREKIRAMEQEIAHAEAEEGGGSRGASEGAPEGEAEGSVPAPTSPLAEARDAEAKAVGTRWFAALAKGDAGTMAGLAELPFRTTGGGVVKTRAELGPMFKDLAAELGTRGVGAVQVLTGAGLRSMLGRLPPGLDDGSGLVFATTPLRDGDLLIAALAKRGDDYHVVALVRR